MREVVAGIRDRLCSLRIPVHACQADLYEPSVEDLQTGGAFVAREIRVHGRSTRGAGA
jgi:hypothetical protein